MGSFSPEHGIGLDGVVNQLPLLEHLIVKGTHNLYGCIFPDCLKVLAISSPKCSELTITPKNVKLCVLDLGGNEALTSLNLSPELLEHVKVPFLSLSSVFFYQVFK